MSAFEQIRYDALNARQKELFNFQKLAATLADYGFNRINSWQTKNGFSSRSINPELLNSLAKNKLGPVYGPNLRTI